jgi:hypothetical protein
MMVSSFTRHLIKYVFIFSLNSFFFLNILILPGKRPLADVWALDTAAKPYEWRKLEPEGEGPPPCMYATARARSDGLLLLCGGRDANSVVSQRVFTAML